MKISLRLLIVLVPSIAAIVLAYLAFMQRLENKWLSADLSHRSRLVADSIHDAIVGSLNGANQKPLAKLVSRLSRDSRLMGVVICGRDENLLARSEAVPASIGCAGVRELVSRKPEFLTLAPELKVHRAVYGVIDDEGVRQGYVVVLHDPSYMSRRGVESRAYTLASFLVLALLISVATLLLYRWSVSRTLDKMTRAVRGALRGDIGALQQAGRVFAPLIKDVNEALRKLSAQKLSAAGTGPVWNPQRLRDEVRRLFGESRLCVIANREPCIHNRKGVRIEAVFPASGLVSAVEPIVRSCAGLWIAHGSGSADRETADRNGMLLVPPENPAYALKRVWLSSEEEQGYYYGFSNEGLWPLCHIAHTRPVFRPSDWEHYVRVNERFAKAFVEQCGGGRPVALVQDYHFALLPQMIRKLHPEALTTLFWHIPWPNPESIGICPWKKEILFGMLGADLIGFHTQFHCNNFLDTVDRFLEARVDRETFSVTVRGHTCFVKPFPISIEWPPRHDLPGSVVPRVRSELLDELNLPPDTLIAVGVDRVDYTKGIVERFLAVERLFEKHPELRGKFRFIQIGAPSRSHIKAYKDLNSEVQDEADRINWRFRSEGYEPILLRLQHHDAGEVFRFYRSANVCVVSSLHDGMNLVAKEYVAARSDERGALVLSHFTGASRELREALITNPYDLDETADALHRALTMSESEQADRMRAMRGTISAQNVYAWAAQYLSEIRGIRDIRDRERKDAIA